MTPAEIEQLAREYATTRPAALRLNYGVQRSENGGAAVRAIAMLPALTGAWKHRGGGAQLSTSGAFAWNEQALRRPDLALASPLGRLARVVNMSLGQALTELGTEITDSEMPDDGPPVMRSLSTTRTPARSRPIRTPCGAAWSAPISSPSSTSCSLPTPPTTPISFCPQPRFLSTRIFRAHTATTLCSFQSRPSSRPARRARTCGSSASLRSAWASPSLLPRHAGRDDSPGAGHRAPDGHSTNAGMEHITFEDLEREGHIPLAFHRTRSKRSCRIPPARFPRPPARSSFSLRLGCRRSRPPSGFCAAHRIALGQTRSAIRSSCWPAKTTTT